MSGKPVIVRSRFGPTSTLVFARGELPRLAMAAMQAEAKPLPMTVIARRALAAKGETAPPPRLVKVTKNRLHNLLLAWDDRGLTCKAKCSLIND